MTAFVVDLKAPPKERWRLPEPQVVQARVMLDVYLRDLGANDDTLALLEASTTGVVPEVFRSEMAGLAEHIGVPLSHVLAGNLYYDVLKVMWGCTAFAIDTEHGPIHARNLDWWTRGRVLNDFTSVT